MAGEKINYRVNLIRSENWIYEGATLIGNIIHMPPNSKIKQEINLPQVYPTRMLIKVKLAEDLINKFEPNIFFKLIATYRDKETQRMYTDEASLPSYSPVFESESLDEKNWSVIETIVNLRDTPGENSGMELTSLRAEIINMSDSAMGYSNLSQLYSTNGALPTYGDGDEFGSGGGDSYIEKLENGDLKWSHPSGSYMILGRDVEIYAVGNHKLIYSDGGAPDA